MVAWRFAQSSAVRFFDEYSCLRDLRGGGGVGGAFGIRFGSIVAANPGHEAQNYLWVAELIVLASRGDSLLTKTVPRSRGARGGELSRCETALDAVKGLGFRERVRLGGARLVGRSLGGRILAGHRVCERQCATLFAPLAAQSSGSIGGSSDSRFWCGRRRERARAYASTRLWIRERFKDACGAPCVIVAIVAY